MSARLRPRSRADRQATGTAGVAEVAAGPGQQGNKDNTRLAVSDAYTLHAETVADGTDPSRRTMLVRYVLRPPFAPSQISAEPGARVSFRLSHPFATAPRTSCGPGMRSSPASPPSFRDPRKFSPPESY